MIKLKLPSQDFTVIQSDCLSVIQALQILPILNLGFDSLVTDPPAGIGFMNKSWDSDKGGRTEWIAWLERIMKYSIRLLKPGAHGLVWALPRTSHWTAMALESAGFEVRDIVSHHYGNGFPKSNNISKAIDKKAKAKRVVIGHTPNARPNRVGKLTKLSGPMTIGGEITKPQTDMAKTWDGYGTALKPATEHWILVRKPFETTVERNVIRHGTGGLNIDASRINTKDNLNGGSYSGGERNKMYLDDTRSSKAAGIYGEKGRLTPDKFNQPAGRWPANLILSHSEDCQDSKCQPGCPIKILNKQSGIKKDGIAVQRNGGGQKIGGQGIYQGSKGLVREDIGFNGSGGASRFFYCAKPSKRERSHGLNGKLNHHPTVKSKALMTYLIKLITPPGGTVLDIFCGSGSTGVAAVSNGWKFFGIEQDPEFAEIARQRILAARK